jgi:hypothetical protein
MSTVQSSVRDLPANRPTPMDDDPAAIVRKTGYYDPDSAAFDEDPSVPVMSAIDSTDEGLPKSELVPA